HEGPDREHHAAPAAPGQRRAHHPEGEVLGDVPLPDVLASRHARRLARFVVDRGDRAVRGGEDRPRHSPELIELARRKRTYSRPSFSFAASDIRSRSHGGSKVISTRASVTPGTARTA